MTAAKSGLAAFIERNLWAVLASAAALWSGYLAGQMTMQNQINLIDDRLKRMEDQMKGRAEFMSCAIRTMDRVTAQLKTAAPCDLKMTE